MKITQRIAIIFFLATFLGSCATIDQKITLSPIVNQHPVSSSASLFTDGKIITEDKYMEAKEFKLVKLVNIPYPSKQGSFDISSDLEDALPGFEYDGIAKLRLSILNIDTSNSGWILLERNFAYMLGSVGAVFLAAGVIDSSLLSTFGMDNSFPLAMLAASGAFAGVSIIQERTGNVVYSVGVSGLKVKF